MSNHIEGARVGVVVRTQNRPWFLDRALRDITSQSFEDWLVIVVNDGGDRREVERVVAAVGPSFSARVRVEHSDTATGRSAAANRGMKTLSGCDFVVLHDDDDLWHRDFLALTVRWLDSHSGDVGVVVPTEIIYEVADGAGFIEKSRTPFWPGLRDITYSDLLQVNRAVPISYLYRRWIHDDVGYYREDLHAVEDWEFNLRTALHHHIGFIVGEPLAFWMQRVGVDGDAGNSMFTLADEHLRYDRLVRDEALRAYVQHNGPGLPLYLTGFIEAEVARQLDARSGLGQRAIDALRGWRRERRQ